MSAERSYYYVNIFISFLLTSFLVKLCEAQNSTTNPTLTIEDGKIRGQTRTTVGKGTTYYAFRGIPFAKPPIGNLRFEPPVKNEKWNDTLDATQDKNECTQGSNPVSGSEDCLYINVYTTNLSSSANLPVMVWIYGGGFSAGNSSYSLYGPDYFLDENVVFVSFNYRLGIFGFISTGDLAAPGNTGLKDQAFALGWVQRNIRYFGGDPRNVTIFGQSAGSASVSYLVQSEQAKGMFKAAIMESGSSLSLWALNRRATATAFLTGVKLNIRTTASTTLIKELKKINASVLQEASNVAATIETLKDPLAGIFFGPVIEPYHEGAFFYNKSDLILSQGKFNQVPCLMGVTSHEAAAASDVTGLLSILLLRYDLDNIDLAPADLTNVVVKKSVAAAGIRLHYFGVLPLSLQTDRGLVFISDDQFNRPVRRSAQDMSPYVRTYFYVFSHEGVLGRAQRNIRGVGHTEELRYLFAQGDNVLVSRSDGSVRQRLIRLWTNFAKYSNPTPIQDPLLENVTWPTSGSITGHLTYLNISQDLAVQVDPFNDNMRFYDRIYRQYGDPPYDTY